MTPPIVSFIVPVRDDAARLAKCLRSIRDNDCPPSQVEIVVVDNGSTDGSTLVARRFGAHVRTIPRASVADLRNQGARQASGEVLAFVDADHEIAPGWVSAVLDTLRLESVGAAGALCHAPAGGTWVQRAYAYLRGRARGRHDVEWLGSGNLAVWHRTFDAVGGFDTALEACEDVDLCNRIRRSGLRVVSDSRLDNIHYGDPKTLRDLFRSELWRGRDNLRVSFRGPVSWRGLPSAIVPIIDLAMVAVAPIGLVAALSGWQPGLALTLAALLVILAAAASKVSRALAREPGIQLLAVLQTFVVACVYDLARALALVTRVSHRAARQSTAPAAS
jgi:glycosyltransferase involved in cell wall biosynthesis